MIALRLIVWLISSSSMFDFDMYRIVFVYLNSCVDVFEEKVMAVDNAPPLVVIGCEGLWGTVLSILVVYPLAYLAPGQDNGSFENPFDALAMITSSPQLTVKYHSLS